MCYMSTYILGPSDKSMVVFDDFLSCLNHNHYKAFFAVISY